MSSNDVGSYEVKRSPCEMQMEECSANLARSTSDGSADNNSNNNSNFNNSNSSNNSNNKDNNHGSNSNSNSISYYNESNNNVKFCVSGRRGAVAL